MFNQVSGDSMSTMKMQDLSGLPNLANPPAPSQKIEPPKVMTAEERYDNLFSSDDETEKRAKEQQKKAQSKSTRSREDPRFERKNRDAKAQAEEQRQKISASHIMYRASSDQESSRAQKVVKEQEKLPSPVK
jgi:hypothetical protein